MQIFEMSKRFPPEERYSLTDQIRRSSRSVCTNLREAWAKRRYEAHFVSKLKDADGENGETETWLDFRPRLRLFVKNDHAVFLEKRREIGAIIGSMINDPSSFVLRPSLTSDL
jgi:four helix bundle protein